MRDPRVLEGARRLPPLARTARGRSHVDLLRGASHRQRQAWRAPRGAAHVQGRLSAIQDDDRTPRASQGRLGLPRPAGRARGGEGDRHHRQARHRGVRHRGVQRPLPRVGDAVRRRVRAPHRADRVLDRPRRRVLDDGPRVHRIGLVVAEVAARARVCSRRPTGSRRTARGAAPRCPTPRWRWATRPSRTRASSSGSRSSAPAIRPSTARRCSCGPRRRGRSRPTPAPPSPQAPTYVVVEARRRAADRGRAPR